MDQGQLPREGVLSSTGQRAQAAVPMPRYQFHCTYGNLALPAEDRELGNLEDARLDAIVYAAKLLSSRPEVAWTGRSLNVKVFDETGGPIITVEITATMPQD